MEMVEMASAHLNNIQNAIGDLQKQKANIESEIEKLIVGKSGPTSLQF